MDKENKEIIEFWHDDLRDYLIGSYQPVFFELEGISRVLGSEHPVVRLMEDAVNNLDQEKLEAAQAAFYTLPEHVLDRARHPWIGSPPSQDTHKKLGEQLIHKLICEVYSARPAKCYLQIDAREVKESTPLPAGEDGHEVNPALVYDLWRDHYWPVRVQILEGSDPMAVKDLLKKILHKLDQDWDKLIDPGSYPNIFPGGDPEAW